MDKKEKRICKGCNKALRAIGDRRKNGTYRHNDWDTRAWHKICWRDLKIHNEVCDIIKNFNYGFFNI